MSKFMNLLADRLLPLLISVEQLEIEKNYSNIK